LSFGLPYPSAKYLPRIYGDNADAGFTALTAKMDADLLSLRSDVIELYHLKNSDRCKALLLDELGYMVGAGILSYDTETQKRKKIYYAIVAQKIRGTWAASTKPIFDAITGYDARILNTYPYKQAMNIWVECDGVNNTGTSWAPDGAGDIAGYLGVKESCPGGTVDPEVPGIIYINCHYGVFTAVLSAATIAALVYMLQTDVIPAYMVAHLCYIDAGGLIQTYAGGIIN